MALSSVQLRRAERNLTPPTPLLLRSLRENYYRGGWHGPSVAVREAVRGLDASAAAWRPGAGRHNIWELTLHLAYARQMMLGRMGFTVPAFPHRLTKPWWPELPSALTVDAWAADVALPGIATACTRVTLGACECRCMSSHRRIHPAVSDRSDA